jgi:hypothetical protein
MTAHNLPLSSRLEARTIKDSVTGCWLWQGTISDGYGQLKYEGKVIKVHRLSAMIYLGYNLSDEIYQVLHNAECPNRNCWNPDHLHIGTNEDNHAERKPKTHCVNGHEYTPENTTLTRNGRYRCKICHHKHNQQHQLMKYGNNNKQQQ